MHTFFHMHTEMCLQEEMCVCLFSHMWAAPDHTVRLSQKQFITSFICVCQVI